MYMFVDFTIKSGMHLCKLFFSMTQSESGSVWIVQYLLFIYLTFYWRRWWWWWCWIAILSDYSVYYYLHNFHPKRQNRTFYFEIRYFFLRRVSFYNVGYCWLIYSKLQSKPNLIRNWLDNFWMKNYDWLRNTWCELYLFVFQVISCQFKSTCTEIICDDFF